MNSNMGWISVALFSAIAVISIAVPIVAQTAQMPAFDEASIKLHLASDPRPTAIIVRGHRVVVRGYTLRELVLLAYSPRTEPMLDQLLAGGPAWAATDRVDIEAKTSEGRITREQLHLMLQSLLTDRFELSLHREVKEMSVYELIITKPGKLKLAKDQSLPVLPPVQAAVGLSTLLYHNTRGTSGRAINAEGVWFRGTAMPLPAIAALLQTAVDRPVIDKTGLTGLFDMQVMIRRREDVFPVSRPAVSVATALMLPPLASEPATNPVFKSLQEETGLRLQPSQGAVSVLVIDLVSKPWEN
jgi:uncharacterized protein (TIGR03435 family)